MPSPACQVKNGAAAYVATTNGVDVTPGNTITINLIDSSADTWSIECVYTDDLSVAATVTASLVINTALRTATFTAPVAGRAYIFRSRVNNGNGPDGKTKSSYTTTFGVFTLASGGNRVMATNETVEGNATFGWITKFNSFIRAGAGSPTPTGTGFRHVTSGTEDAAARAVNLASADVTGTLPAANGGTGQNSSAWTGLPKVASGVWSTFAIAAGIEAFLTTPSSANLRAALTDETGSGAAVFATSPVLVTPSIETINDVTTINGNAHIYYNAADTFAHVFQHGGVNVLFVAASGVEVNAPLKLRDAGGAGPQYFTFVTPDIAANRSINLPLLTANDTMAVLGLAQTFSARQTFSGGWSAGGTVAATGDMRIGVGFTIKSVVGGTDRQVFEAGSGAEIIFGEWTNGGPIYLRTNSAGEVRIQINSDNQLVATASLLQIAKPRVGFSTPYASEGRATQAMADADQTAAASVYSRRIVRITGALTAQRTLTFPHPASEDASYEKIIINETTGGFQTVISTGTGSTVGTGSTPGTHMVLTFTPSGVERIVSR